MLYFKIGNLKKFMGQLFAGDIFDSLYVTECEIHMLTQINISGIQNKKWSETEYGQNIFCSWKQMKEMVYSVIKGKKTPSYMKIIFSGKPDCESDSGTLTLRFEDDAVILITGYATKEFSLDKSDEREWDALIESILVAGNVDFKEKS